MHGMEGITLRTSQGCARGWGGRERKVSGFQSLKSDVSKFRDQSFTIQSLKSRFGAGTLLFHLETLKPLKRWNFSNPLSTRSNSTLRAELRSFVALCLLGASQCEERRRRSCLRV